jgi:hypothetical protein
MKAVFAGSFAMRLADPVKKQLKYPCEIVTGNEAAILQQHFQCRSLGLDGVR